MTKENPVFLFPGRRVVNPIMHDRALDQIELIQETRLNDLENIRLISIYSTLPLVIISFGVGYIITSLQLKPLERLNREMINKSTKNLSNEIEFKDSGDEIASLIKSFNRMSKRLSRSFESQKEFVENASHELKTPLAVIQANIESALEDGSISKEELKELLEDSKKSVTFMNKLTEDLLLLSVLEVEVKKEELDLNEVLNNAVNLVKKLESSKKFAFEITSSKSVSFVGNDVLLQRAFSNIVENSVKYSRGKKVEISIVRKEDRVVIKFIDDGVGISKENREKIFDRFYRIDKSRARNSGGSGLGLSIAKEIIKKHNGEISVKNRKGGGAVFEIVLLY
jgi:signal transduction histidine kinase